MLAVAGQCGSRVKRESFWHASVPFVSLSRENVRVNCSAILSVEHLGISVGITTVICSRRRR